MLLSFKARSNPPVIPPQNPVFSLYTTTMTTLVSSRTFLGPALSSRSQKPSDPRLFHPESSR